MDIKVLEKQENPLQERKIFDIEISFDGSTPKKSQVLKEILSELKLKEELVYMPKIENKFGYQKARIILYVYDSIESRKKFEVVRKVKTATAQA